MDKQLDSSNNNNNKKKKTFERVKAAKEDALT